MAGLAGCVEGIQSHFQGSFQGIIPIEITNESDLPQNLQLEAREEETGRETYDQSFNVNVDERVQPQHLDASDQQFRAARIEDDEPVTVESVAISAEANLVLIRLYEDEIELEVVYDEEEAENVTEGDDIETVAGDDAETDAGGDIETDAADDVETADGDVDDAVTAADAESD